MNRAAWIAQQRGRKAVLYVVRVYTAGEAFYKVGVTYNISARWSRITTLYRWRTLARYSSWDAGSVFDLEQRLHRGFAHLSYTPSSAFAGHTECYTDAAPILKALPRETFFLKLATDI
ncbi:GIY-YIG nuclease family protein [Hymenobacter arizonensis]|uniref:T5orf172 domain-containing protein n=1 Tax=Hymenobacter arizonensis TaxID=1227077 RepID=A0A1I5YYI4_HYMAR|nr:GIY-YIG nuclease family protein [Hymenobacter arizonensis]SFQ49190.1 T5orf172 domain-containing protein [Hymenobacter arizonensis]